MLDNALIALVGNAIIAGEAVAGIAGYPLKQAFQPTNQGVNKVPTLYFQKIADKLLGLPFQGDIWNSDSGVMDHTQIQQYETTFQLSALATQDPNNVSAYTASDIVNLAASILQSNTTIAILEAQNVGILKISNVRNPYFKDDKGRFEASPSLDFTLTHKQIIMSVSPVIDITEFDIFPI